MRPVELLPIKGLRVRREVANLPTPAGPQAPQGLVARASPVCDSAQRCHAGGARYGHGSPDLSKVECPSLQYAEKSKISFRHRSPLRARLRYSTQDSTARTAIALPLRSNARHSKHASQLIEEAKRCPSLQKNTHAKTDSELTHSRFFRKSRPAQLSPMTRYRRARERSDRKKLHYGGCATTPIRVHERENEFALQHSWGCTALKRLRREKGGG